MQRRIPNGLDGVVVGLTLTMRVASWKTITFLSSWGIEQHWWTGFRGSLESGLKEIGWQSNLTSASIEIEEPSSLQTWSRSLLHHS
jgi:hypothetical protein